MIRYRIASFTQTDIVPEGAIFLESSTEPRVWSPHTGQVFSRQKFYTFLIPITEQKLKPSPLAKRQKK